METELLGIYLFGIPSIVAVGRIVWLEWRVRQLEAGIDRLLDAIDASETEAPQ